MALAALTSCAVSQLAFAQDSRLHFVTPRPRALVTLPVTLIWTIQGFTIAESGTGRPSKSRGYFALFLDRAPIGPGQGLTELADRSCNMTHSCSGAQYLAERGVYTTTRKSLRFEQIPAGSPHANVQLHEVTVVLMDTAGHRIGDSAWCIDFRLRSTGS